MKKLLFFLLIIFIGILAVLGRRFFITPNLNQVNNLFSATLNLKYLPTQAKLKINNRQYSSPNGTLSISLPPGEYHLQLSLPGYSMWEKDIQLTAQEIKTIPPIFLFPLQWTHKTLLKEPLKTFSPSIDYNQLLYITQGPKYDWCIYKRQTKEKNCFWNNSQFPQEVTISPSFKKAIIEFKNNDWQLLFLPPSLVSTPLPINSSLKTILAQSKDLPIKTLSPILQVAFNPDNENELIIRSKNYILLFNFVKDTVIPLYQGQSSPFLVAKNKIYLVASNGLLLSIAIQSPAPKTLSLFSFNSNNLEDIIIKKFPNKDIFLVIDNSHHLYLLQPKQNIPSVIADNIQNINISPKNDAILLWNNNKIIICSYPQLIKSENEIHSDSLPQWFLNNHYILINNGASLQIYNLDSKKIWPLASDVKDHIYYYDSSVNYLFYLSSSGIQQISL